MIINEIFLSIDGEAKRAGELATFIRSVGCPLRCTYCDSKYTWEAESTNVKMSVKEIIDVCENNGARNITFTGGEPLIQKDADELIEELASKDFDVSIETCGAVDFTERRWFKNNIKNVWVCADYKCYESGEESKMISLDKFAKLRSRDVLKFVVGSQKDLELAKDVMTYLRKKRCKCHFYLSPVFGKIEPLEIVNFIVDNKLQDKVKFQLQLHKFVWDADARGV